MFDIQQLYTGIQQGDYRSIARAITLVENELIGHNELLLQLSAHTQSKLVGITGPPGAGKSTLINAMIRQLLTHNYKVAVLSVDPSSPFNFGALLGDRVRMSEFYLHPNVYIRSLASRGALGGLSPKIIEISEVLKAAPFDYILIETVGVGQSEVEIAGLADTTIVVMVPEAGDEVQTMKAGVMEIADIFVVNKSDRAQAEKFLKNLLLLSHSKNQQWQIPVIKCIATENTGINDILQAIDHHHSINNLNLHRKSFMLTEKIWQLLQNKHMTHYNKIEITQQIQQHLTQQQFQLFQYVQSIYKAY